MERRHEGLKWFADSQVGPRQVLDFMSDFLRKEADFGFRMAVFGLKLSCLGTLSLAAQERDWID
jgi:hypothetical protein